MNCVDMKEIDRRFREMNKPNYFKDFVNSVIFPMKGDVPVTAQISGSDLDGDNFFICWEPSLIPA
jgi:hypothetical protein